MSDKALAYYANQLREIALLARAGWWSEIPDLLTQLADVMDGTATPSPDGLEYK
jgi:hypothetical protein